ncbi:MAG TPA: CooT family nickel-binding protein [Candidatus Anoxymicrobiaceae bacterium]|jgi:predicted RNA-binding protein
MCEAIVYMVKNGDKQQIMENVVTIQPDGERLLLTDLFGEQKLITATVDRIDLLSHEIILK